MKSENFGKRVLKASPNGLRRLYFANVNCPNSFLAFSLSEAEIRNSLRNSSVLRPEAVDGHGLMQVENTVDHLGSTQRG
jgi:hypothetical protein